MRPVHSPAWCGACAALLPPGCLMPACCAMLWSRTLQTTLCGWATTSTSRTTEIAPKRTWCVRVGRWASSTHTPCIFATCAHRPVLLTAQAWARQSSPWLAPHPHTRAAHHWYYPCRQRWPTRWQSLLASRTRLCMAWPRAPSRRAATSLVRAVGLGCRLQGNKLVCFCAVLSVPQWHACVTPSPASPLLHPPPRLPLLRLSRFLACEEGPRHAALCGARPRPLLRLPQHEPEPSGGGDVTQLRRPHRRVWRRGGRRSCNPTLQAPRHGRRAPAASLSLPARPLPTHPRAHGGAGSLHVLRQQAVAPVSF